jgi:hypothetical protein
MSPSKLQHGSVSTMFWLLVAACGGTSKAPEPRSDCSPGARFCNGSTVEECTDGGERKVVEICESGSCTDGRCGNATCASGDCEPPIEPDEPDEPDEPGATVCVEGERVCDGADVYQCVEGGSELLLLVSCSEGEVCDDATGGCRRAGCEPERLGCDGSLVATCNAQGSGWEPTGVDCADQGKVCRSGACEQSCKPSSSYCQDGGVYQCDATGRASLREQCGPSTHCEEYSGVYAACIWHNDSCEPGTPFCYNNAVTMCGEDGRAAPGGVDCGVDGYCLDAACYARDCEPNTRLCRDGDVYECEHSGVAFLEEECVFPASVCVTVESSAHCLAPACQPGSKACVGNQVGTCKPDGSGLSAVSQDCTADDEVCDPSFSCVARAVETLGAIENRVLIEPNLALGNVFDVHSDRRLLELELYLVIAAPVQVRWIVFEEADGYRVRVEQTTQHQPGSGFVSSGPLGYTLEAGRHYLLGVQILGASADVSVDELSSTVTTSFGRPRASMLGSSDGGVLVDPAYYQNRLYTMRLTTELP